MTVKILPEGHADLMALETLVDRHGIAAMVQALSTIAALKGEHVRGNWQDNKTARQWDKASTALDTLAHKIANWVTL